MGWTDYRRRYRLRHAVLDEVGRRGAERAVTAWAAEIEAEYGGLPGLAADVRVHWDRVALVRADAAAEAGGSPAAARVELAAEQRPVLALLAYAEGRAAGVSPVVALAG